ncbi:MAG: DUF5946 family protein [Acidobacteriaceae bacterium]
MDYKCPDCGATHSNDTTCQAFFDSFLVLEYTLEDYGIVHPFTVGCYFIQHGLYSQEALIWIEHILSDSIKFGSPSRYMLQNMRKAAGRPDRTWKITRNANAPGQPKITWSMTIADVATSYHDAASYCDLVRMWAHTTYNEMKPLLPPL